MFEKLGVGCVLMFVVFGLFVLVIVVLFMNFNVEDWVLDNCLDNGVIEGCSENFVLLFVILVVFLGVIKILEWFDKVYVGVF